jgi:CheY-like chemotaxis protein/uncharacterized Zn finger protein (UPF0148 family)
VGRSAARHAPETGQQLGPDALQVLLPAGVGDLDPQDAAVEGHDLGAAGQLRSHRRGPRRPEQREGVLRSSAEEPGGEIGVAGAVHGASFSYVILALRSSRLTVPRDMNCPRCKSPVGPLPNPDGIITCPGCGTRLMTRSAAERAKAAGPAAPPPPTSAPNPEPAAEPTAEPATLDLVLREVRALREGQREVLASLEELRRARPAAAPADDEDAPSVEPIRARRRKTVLLLDDDPATCEEAKAELEKADVPVRTCDDGRAALAMIAEQKPDVVALEVGMGGEMGGKDLVNVIKATMEWVDIPIILWTREPVAGQKEARQLHGADDVALKAGGAAALVARVITLFRRP